MKVKVFLCSPRSGRILSSIIKRIQKTDYSHYAIGFESHTGHQMVLDATSKNVATRMDEIFLKTHKIVRTYNLDLPCDYDVFSSWYEAKLGIKYGYFQLIGVLVKDKKLGKGMICCELVLRMMKDLMGVPITDIDIRDLNYTEEIRPGDSSRAPRIRRTIL